MPRSWGKQFLIELPAFALRVHFMLWGSYRNERKEDRTPRLALGFARGAELNFYSCSLRFIDEPLDQVYDWRSDVMSDQWDPALARRRLRAQPDKLVCDALLDQDLFAGVGNIIKNEVLFRIRVHPLSKVGALPGALQHPLRESAPGPHHAAQLLLRELPDQVLAICASARTARADRADAHPAAGSQGRGPSA